MLLFIYMCSTDGTLQMVKVMTLMKITLKCDIEIKTYDLFSLKHKKKKTF